ncbi:hypothetical protein [Kallotenue papyrolyticum]|uniref:hypothetical protein n=1 Tax=Kallotenue papyrolyticum TaxID=1325125 RepID=UPI00047862F1|nr:hypothetical protein [Kallotenue papyrolyticum]
MQLRWPNNAEWARKSALEAAESGAECLRDAQAALRQDDHRAVAECIAEAIIQFTNIRIWMIQAKVGKERE